MVITAHFCSYDKHGNLLICNCLVAFQHISEAHSEIDLAEHFITILKELGIMHKVKCFNSCFMIAINYAILRLEGTVHLHYTSYLALISPTLQMFSMCCEHSSESRSQRAIKISTSHHRRLHPAMS